ncbi:MAG: sulfatase-like hydrolase/transferase [Planctomycetota bacterium]|jgi:arylsulfatase A
MDKLIGRIVSTLDELGLRQNTLILFTTDNGTPREFITKAVDGKYIEEPIISKVGDNTIIGGKGKLTDAGTRVPLIANWPGTTPAGKVCDDLIDFSDFMPTFAELAGTTPPKDRVVDGVSFAPQLKGKKGNPRAWAYCQSGAKAWVRTKRWKLYRDGRLYDMQNDHLEKSPILPHTDRAETSKIRKRLRAVLGSLKNA